MSAPTKLRVVTIRLRSLQAILLFLLLSSSACSSLVTRDANPPATLSGPADAYPTPGHRGGAVEPLPVPEPQTAGELPVFDGGRAYQSVARQLEFGPRVSGSPAAAEFRDWLQAELEAAGWQVLRQESEELGHPIVNLVARRGTGAPWLILGAHYDSRLIADRDPDPDLQKLPVPGANDGASGVAVLLELAHTLPPDRSGEVWLVFFDAEDNGNLPGWEWILGSQAFVRDLQAVPDAVVVIDMIGDADLTIYIEQSSNFLLAAEIWGQAAGLGYADVIIPIPKYRILDDHTPFLVADIPAVLLIDFDYPYWHTSQDTLDKLSPDSLQAVGDTLLAWLISRLGP